MDPDDEYDDAYWAELATIGSSDSNFTSTSDGGTIYFKTEGGSVTVTVDCGCDWTIEDSASDLFPATITNSTTFTVSATQNTVEEDVTGTIILLTASARISFATVTITQAAYGAPEITVETNEHNFAAKGDLTAEIAVTASEDTWTSEAADFWLTVEKSGDSITLTATENEDTSERSTKVTLTCTDGIRTAYEYINVTQDGKAYVTLSTEDVLFSGAGDSATVTVESNYDWDYGYDTDNDWFTVSRADDVLTITATKDNQTEGNFEGTVTITAGDGAENVTEAQISVIEDNSGRALILVYTITDAGTTITLPLQGTVDCTVSWGDGNSETVTATKPTHTYENAGEYSVMVNGTVTSLSHSGISSSSKKNTTLTAVKQWGNTGLTSASYALYYCQALTSIPDDTIGAFADVTTCAYMFEYCIALTSIPDGLFAYAASVTSFNYCFAYCSALTAIPSALFAKCADAQTFQYTFSRCTALTTIGEGAFDGCTAATSFYYTFGYCEALKDIPAGIFSKNTKVTTFYNVFRNCTALTTIPENLFANCSAVTTFGYAFYLDAALTSVPESTFSGCSAVTTYIYAFYGCSALTSVPENLFKDSTVATTFTYVFRGTGLTSIPENLFANNTAADTFAYCFYNCTDLTSVPGGLFRNNPKVTTFADTFYGCSSLKEIGSGLFANNPLVTIFNSTFYGCSSLQSIPENLFSGCKAVTNFTSCFYGCSGLTGESAYDVVSVGGENVNVHLYEREYYTDEIYGYTAPASYSNCYKSCTGLSDYYTTIPTAWGGEESKDLSAVIGTYAATAYTYFDTDEARETTWTLKIYQSNKANYDILIDGLVPAASGKYPSIVAYVAQATYSNGRIVVPVQTSNWIYNSTNYYMGWYPCTGYEEGKGWSRSESVTNITFTYDSAIDTWTSDYGAFLALFDGGPTYANFYGFLDVANPGITLSRTSTTTGNSNSGSNGTSNAKQAIDDNLVIHTEGLFSER